MRRLFFLIFTLSSFLSFAEGPWNQRATFGGLGRHRSFSFSIGNKGYLGCGWQGTLMYDDFWEYDPASNTWTQKADYLGGARLSPFGFAIGNKGYAGTGLDQPLNAMSDFYEYDAITNTWTQKANFIGSARFSSSAVVLNGKAYIGLGDEWAPGYNRVSDIYEYNPVTESWAYETTYPADGRRDPVSFVIGNKLYFGLGNDNSFIEQGDFYQYDPVTNFWTQKASFGGSPRSQSNYFAVNGKGYVGMGGLADLNDFWEYNAATNTWRGINELPGAGRENSMSFVIGSKAYIACGTNGINFQDCWEFNPQYVTGVEEQQNNLSVTIFPNPMKESATLQINGELKMDNGQFELYDINGKCVSKLSIVNYQLSIERGNLSAGTYLYNIVNEGTMFATGKLIVQ